MEGVEDIPGAALSEGLSWDWTGFDGFLDAVDARPHDIDVAAQVPHAALRLHVMGERGADHESVATPEEIAEMGRIAAAGIEAGALGFTTSRTRNHRASTGEFTPTLTAERAELVGIAEAIGATGTGVLQMVGDFIDAEYEFGTLVEMMRSSGRPLSFTVAQSPMAPDSHTGLLDRITQANADGFAMRGQVAPRAIGLLMGLDCTLNPFMMNPVWAEIALAPLAEKVDTMRDPEFRRRMLENHAKDKSTKTGGGIIGVFERMFPLTDPPDYEPDTASSAASGRRSGRRHPGGVGLRLPGRGRRRSDALRAVPQLRRRQPRRDPRDARPPVHRARPVRRWRPRRHDLRRQLPDLPAHPLGSRPCSRWPVRTRMAREPAHPRDGEDGGAR